MILGIIFNKGIIVSKSIYSLILDRNGQEAGALLRVLVEVIELMRYLREDESRIQEVINKKLPSAGKIAKKINGKFHNLRNYLNDNASHFNISFYSSIHLIDFEEHKLIIPPKFNEKIFLSNINTISIFMLNLCLEGVFSIRDKVDLPKELLNKIENCRLEILKN